jgi:predicted dehydrogenase
MANRRSAATGGNVVTPLAVGLIGVGFHARTVHIPALDVVGEMRLRAVATSREETARDAAERHRVQGYADYREVLDRTDIEAVIIATPPEMHQEICRAALQRGKHVFVESPGIPDVEGARAVLDMARQYRRVVQVGFLLRYSAPFDLLKANLDAQAAPRLFCYEYFPFLAHVYNLALYLSGPVERVIAATRDAAGRTATVRFHNGDTAVIIGRNLANCSVDIERVQVSTERFFAAVEGRRRVRVIANMQPVDVAEWSLASSAATTYAGQVFAERFLEHSGAAAQLRGFARAIRDGVAPRSTLEDAIETQLLAREIDEKLA